MHYVQGENRYQMKICCLDDAVDARSIARVIDAFVESLDIKEYLTREYSLDGRPPYDPKSLLKLYIYGNRMGIRSSRKLALNCKINVEVMWMIGNVEPDFRTISDFRKENVTALKKVFHEFNRRVFAALETGYTSVDGSKFRANNAKDNNFTISKLDDRIKWLDQHAAEYLNQLQEMDEQDDLDEKGELTKAEIDDRLQKCIERMKRYEGYRNYMEENGMSQISLTDVDAKLMKSRNGFEVAFNPQTAVDSETHMILNYQMTNQVTDHGLMYGTLEEIKKENPDKILEATADRGYENTDDMLKCLEGGIVPHVISEDGKDGFEIETEYSYAADPDRDSENPEELSKCLHAGIIPKAYEEYIEDIQVKEVKVKVYDEPEETKSPYGTETEMMEHAKEGYFVRDPERNLVYCPAGNILRKKSVKRDGKIRYYNKLGCKNCKYRDICCRGKNEWKEIDFSKDQLEKPLRGLLKDKQIPNTTTQRKGHFENVKVVTFKLKPDKSKTMNRLCLSEHPFGTIKRAMGADYFLLRGLKKVDGEFALFCLGYNIQRAYNILGFEKMMELMRAN